MTLSDTECGGIVIFLTIENSINFWETFVQIMFPTHVSFLNNDFKKIKKIIRNVLKYPHNLSNYELLKPENSFRELT